MAQAPTWQLWRYENKHGTVGEDDFYIWKYCEVFEVLNLHETRTNE